MERSIQISHQYNIPFSFKLPASIPSSFEGTHGHIRYKVTAVVDRDYNYVSEWDDEDSSNSTSESRAVCFTGNNHMDLNLNPVAKPGVRTLQISHQYNIPFSSKLPASIPLSFEGTHGHIRYEVTAVIDRRYNYEFDGDPCSKNISECRVVRFTVKNLMDLNLNPVAKMPVSETESKNIRCWISSSGPVTAHAWLSQSGYAPGQIIYFNGTVDNLSKKKMKGSTVRLIQITTYKAKGNEKHVIRVIRSATHGSFDVSDVWGNVPFLIPSLPPTDESLSKLIKVSYRIEFIIDPGRHASKLTLPLDVIIGNGLLSLSSVPGALDIPPNDPAGNNQRAAVILLVDAAVPPRYEDFFFAHQTIDNSSNDQPSNSRPFTPRDVTYAGAAHVVELD